MSATDEIYRELWDGLEKGLDWPQFLASHSTSKGPLYTAIGNFFNEIGTKIAASYEENNSMQSELEQTRLTLESLEKKAKEAQHNVVSLENQQNALNEQVMTLEAKLIEKSELMKQVIELEKLSFNIEVLRQLKDTLTEIGTKYGLKGKEAVSKFFSELKDYDVKTGFEMEIHRLETITGTKKLEAEKWQAEAESSLRRYKDLSEAIASVQGLMKHGVKIEQIVSWNGIVSKLGGPRELQDNLGQYKSITELLTAKKGDIEACEERVKKLSAQVKALNEQKVEIEAAIKSLSTSGVKKIAEVSSKALTGLNSLSIAGQKEFARTSDMAMIGLKSVLVEIKAETKNLADLNARAGNLEKELMLARYFTTGDQTVLKSFPREVVIAFMERALVYCKLNQLNPKVRVPDDFSRKYTSIFSSTQVELIDLIRWAEAGLAGAL